MSETPGSQSPRKQKPDTVKKGLFSRSVLITAVVEDVESAYVCARPTATENSILLSLHSERTRDGRPLWAPKPHHNRKLNAEDIAYVAKMKALLQFVDKTHEVSSPSDLHLAQKNLKLRYRLNCISKEVKFLKRCKR